MVAPHLGIGLLPEPASVFHRKVQGVQWLAIAEVDDVHNHSIWRGPLAIHPESSSCAARKGAEIRARPDSAAANPARTALAYAAWQDSFRPDRWLVAGGFNGDLRLP